MRLSRHRLNLTASVTALLVATSAAPAMANGLPASGSVAAGSATIATTATTLTVNQSTANAVINWQSFNVGAGDKVVFVQPNASSATLNRVTGATTSTIAGDIAANGSVYLINPNGIQITSLGAINVGRGFVASTLDLADSSFLAGKGTFTGRAGTIANAGTITTQTGGFVGLLAGNVSNTGKILAPAGQVVIGAGTVATLDVNGEGFLQVALPSGSTLSTDGSAALLSGAAARAAVRYVVNLPGSVNALSASGTSGNIDLGGSINVDAASGNAGHIKVLGETVSGDASLSARALGASGNGGLIETSGHTVDFDKFSITTTALHGKTGTWLLDPMDLTIDAAGATALDAALATNSVTLTTDGTTTGSATGSNSTVNPSDYGTGTSGPGDIIIASALNWSSANILTLAAYNNITINAPITATSGSLVLTPGNGASQTGIVTATAAVSVGTFSLTNGTWTQNAATLPAFSATDFSFDADNASFLRVTGGDGSATTPYQITDVYGLQGINSLANLGSSFVLANDIDATGTSKWNGGVGFLPIGIDAAATLLVNNGGGTGFTGSLDGAKHTVNGLTINQSNNDNIGLFAYVGTGGVVQNLGVTAATVLGSSNDAVLAGQNLGTISNSYATGTITENGTGTTGGLVGLNSGTINGGSYAAVAVSGSGSVGGLVGQNATGATITGSHATGAVIASGTVGETGGLVGANYGTITDSYATGAVRGTTVVGGLAGLNQGGASIKGSYATGAVTGNDVSVGIAGGLVGDNAGSIANDSNGFSYATGAVLGTTNVGGLIGQQDSTGTLIGAYATGATKGTSSNVGGLVGASTGSIKQSYATGAVTGLNFVGGLVGANYGTIADTYATGSATAAAIKNLAQVGGLVGQNAALGSGPTPTITRSYATGAVKSTSKNATAIGGLVGSNIGTGNITASFFDTQTTGQSDKNGGTGLTTAEMKSLATYTGASWGIDDAGGTGNVWRIYDGSSYPLLRLFLTPATITYTATPASFTYGTTPTGLTGTEAATGLVGGDTLSSITTGTAKFTTTATATSNAGTYAITGSGLGVTSTAYDITFAQALSNATALTITKSSLTVVTVGLVGSISKTYDGGTAATLTSGNYQLSGFVNGDGATVNQTVGTYASANAGTGITVTANLSASNFTANTGTNLSNYILPTVATGNIGTITQAPLTVTYTASAASSVYGTAASGLTGSVSATGLVGTDTLTGLTTGTAVWTTPATAASNVGTYAINGSGLTAVTGGNYAISFAQAAGNASALTVNPASLTVTYTANPASFVYGTTPSGLTGTVTASGLVNNDTVAGVTSGTAQFTTTASATSNVGTYAITGSGLVANSNNYTISFAQALSNATALTITKANLIAVTAGLVGNVSKTYDGTTVANLTAGNFQLTGFVNGDGASVNQTVGTYASANAGTGIRVTATLSASNFIANTGTDLTNYNLPTSAAGNIGTITQAPVTVTYTASAASSVYGTALGVLTGTINATGLVGSDTLASLTSGTAVWNTPATAASNVGTYAINGSGLTAVTGGNYAVSFAQAAGNANALTVNPASLTLTYTANAATSVYGTTPAGLSGTVNGTGLVNGDMLGNVISGTAVWAANASSSSNVGKYGIVGSGINSASANYTINAVQAAGNATALSITPASLSVIATAATRTYGAANPTFTYTETGLVNSDTLSGSLATSATVTSNVGSYAISQGTLSAGNNYTLIYTGAQLSVTPASLLLTYAATPSTSIYGTTPTGLTGAINATGLLNGDSIASAASGTATWTTGATAASNVGTYAITGSGLTAVTGGNYTVSFAQAAGNASALTVNPASLTVTYTANTAKSVYGTTPGALSGSVSDTGLVNGDTLAGVTSGTAAWSTTAGATSNVGAYAINGNGLAGTSKNYTVNFVQAAGNASALTISPASVSVIATAATRTYGAANPTFTYSETGLVNGDTLSGSLATTATTASNVGGYAITQGTLSASANYTIAYTGAQLSVTPASLTVLYTATPVSLLSGATLTGFTGTVSANGLFNSDTVASVTGGTAIWTTNAPSGATPGSYAIDGSGLVGNSGNYTFSFVQAPGNATALTLSPASSQFGSNTLGQQSPAGGTPPAATDQVVNGNNDVSQLNLDTDALKPCNPGSPCPAKH